MKIEAISISAALPGAQPWKGLRPPRKNVSTWLVETEISSVVEKQYFSSTSTGANRGENARRNSGK